MGHNKRRSEHKKAAQGANVSQSLSPKWGRKRVIVMCAFVGIVVSVMFSFGGVAIEDAWAPGSAKDYNIVLITLDTTRADHVGCYGFERAETPVIDRLAREGIRFADAISPVPMTLPAHCSILTGLDPIGHGVRTNGTDSLKEDQKTLAEMLKNQGYETGAFVSSYVLNARFGLQQGFDVYDDWVEPGANALIGGLTNERDAHRVTNKAISWLKQRKVDQPFFLWTHYYDPHDPHEIPQSYIARFEGNEYDGEIAFVDKQLGRLLDVLSSKNLDKKTIVILTSDHGESLGEHGEPTHTRFIYEATQSVPLIIWSPSLLAGGLVVDDAVVGLIDIVPTVVDMLGLKSDVSFDGIPLNQCRMNPDRMMYIETLDTYLDNGWAPLFGIRRHQDKYILAPRQEYYDLVRDPDELKNLFGARSKRVSSAVQTLSEELTRRRENDDEITQLAKDVEDLDPQARKRLEALGYLGGDGPAATDGELPDPKDMMVVYEMVRVANAQSSKGLQDEAMAKLLKAKELTPNDYSIDKDIGIVYMRMDRLEDAVVSLNIYLESRPTNSNIHALIAQVLLKLQRVDEAKKHLLFAYEESPDNGMVLIAMGDLLTLIGNFDKAEVYYKEGLKVDPYRVEKVAIGRLKKLQQIRRAMGQ